MSFVKQININSVVPSTCAVMDWLQDHGYPECDHTEIVLKNGGYGGLVSNYEPGQFEIESFKSDLPLAKNIMECIGSVNVHGRGSFICLK